jgi:hypothetical protein
MMSTPGLAAQIYFVGDVKNFCWATFAGVKTKAQYGNSNSYSLIPVSQRNGREAFK